MEFFFSSYIRHLFYGDMQKKIQRKLNNIRRVQQNKNTKSEFQILGIFDNREMNAKKSR